MIDDSALNIAIYYDPEEYVDRTLSSGRADEPAGLMGRQVAWQGFLDAYLTHDRWDSLAAIMKSQHRADPLVQLCRSHLTSRSKKRRLQIVDEIEGAARFAGAGRPAELLHFPHPSDSRFTWMRHANRLGAFALSGITHTRSTPVAALGDLLTAPYEPYDALICTSHAGANGPLDHRI